MRLLLILIFCAWAQGAHAVLTIEITQGVQGALPIAVVPFGWEGPGAIPEDVPAVIAADLHRSGRFSPLPRADMVSRPREPAQIRFQDWRMLGMDSVVIGNVRRIGGDGYEVRFHLYDVLRQSQLIGMTFRSDAAGLRRTAHQIADIIYETLLGEPGAFATRIAYITEEESDGSRRYSLQLADADGHGARPMLVSHEPLMSPAWSPDGSRLAYVSFESGAPAIYVQNVDTGNREVVSSERGLNSAPAWSPDGRRLALVLSRDGSPGIYVLELDSRRLTQVTRGFSIDTEPAWDPDGRSIVFTSDRGGKPQIYRVTLATGEMKRLTFEGDYNARPSLSPDGQRLATVHSGGRGFVIGVLELKSGDMQVLTGSGRDESPSFAPNGSMIIYATKEGARGFLSVVSVDGRVRQRLVFEGGQAREPVWSPYLR